MKLKRLFILISLIAATGYVPAQTTGETRAFADSLFLAGNFASALPAYQRTEFFIRPAVDAEILSHIADCFAENGDSKKAVEYYEQSYIAQTNDSLKKEILFRKTAYYLKNNNYAFALMELLNLEKSLSIGFEEKRNFYLGMTWFGLGDFEQSGVCFEKATGNPVSRQKIHEIFSDQKRFNRPNPRLASWLSVFLPGSGQIYSGEIWSGINSLLLTGFFVGVGAYIVTVTSPLDALFTALPWFQRYYQGGFLRASELAKHRRSEHRSIIFEEVLTIIASDK